MKNLTLAQNPGDNQYFFLQNLEGVYKMDISIYYLSPDLKGSWDIGNGSHLEGWSVSQMVVGWLVTNPFVWATTQPLFLRAFSF